MEEILFSYSVVWANSGQKKNLSKKYNTKWVSKVKGNKTDSRSQNRWHLAVYMANSQGRGKGGEAVGRMLRAASTEEGGVLLASDSVLWCLTAGMVMGTNRKLRREVQEEAHTDSTVTLSLAAALSPGLQQQPRENWSDGCSSRLESCYQNVLAQKNDKDHVKSLLGETWRAGGGGDAFHYSC